MAAVFHRFADRIEAGKSLAAAFLAYKEKIDTIVLALPRSGVPVAYEVAKALSIPMDLWLVRKLGVPGREEYAMGALAEGEISFTGRTVLSRMLTARLLSSLTMALPPKLNIS